ncbi:MAG: hypothetical protein J6J36_05725 [Clostridia bacterium]|nr:hypothetical protein [Clostridia bacterium]
MYARILLEEKDMDHIERYITIICNNENAIIENENWNSFILYFLNKYMEIAEGKEDENRERIFDFLMKLSIKFPNSNYCDFIPAYDKLIIKNCNDEKKINVMLKEIHRLMANAIVNEKISMLYCIIEILQKTIMDLENENSNVKELLFSVFINTLSYNVDTEKTTIMEIIFEELEELIITMDKEKYITNKFGQYILKSILNIVICDSKEDEKKIIEVINLLDDLMDDKDGAKFILANNKMKKELYKKMYNIGVQCIENNMENALRIVSNCLGWYIIRSLKNDNETLTNYLIDRTSDLYKIANNMKVTEKTLVFMMTLYTTVGAYCCKESKYYKHLLRIIEIIKREEKDISRIRTATELRTKENDIWDDLFDDQTHKLTSIFMSKLKF